MRLLLALILIVGIAGVAIADSRTTGLAPDKATYQGDNGRDGREGGESWGDAVVIGSLPYSDSGATCDNVDDITLPCASSAAQDVVYRFTASSTGPVSVSLCGSSYDTGLGVYDANQTNLFCNDDFCGLQSQIDFAATAGQTYYFVVDGYSTNCGSYTLAVTAPETCDTSCPPGGQPEGEPPCGPNYVDNTNGGCNSTPQTFGIVCPTDGMMGQFCGMSGNYDFQGNSYRDTDWLVCYGTGGALTLTVCPSFPVQLIYIYGTNCSSPVYDIATGNPFTEVSLSRTVANGAFIWAWIGPSTFTGVPCESPYLLTADGIGTGEGCGESPVQSKTWGGIKNMYK